MSTLKLLCSAVFLASSLLLAGCSGDCSKASDCASDEVCYLELCQKASASYAGDCDNDSNCDSNMDGIPLKCIAGQCRIPGTGQVTPIADTGTSTGADP